MKSSGWKSILGLLVRLMRCLGLYFANPELINLMGLCTRCGVARGGRQVNRTLARTGKVLERSKHHLELVRMHIKTPCGRPPSAGSPCMRPGAARSVGGGAPCRFVRRVPAPPSAAAAANAAR